MPMIQLTLPAGVLTAERRRELQNTLPATLLKWEGAPIPRSSARRRGARSTR
jgi:hypothetical protein